MGVYTAAKETFQGAQQAGRQALDEGLDTLGVTEPDFPTLIRLHAVGVFMGQLVRGAFDAEARHLEPPKQQDPTIYDL